MATRLLEILTLAKQNRQQWDFEVQQADLERQAGDDRRFTRAAAACKIANQLHRDLTVYAQEQFGWPAFPEGLGLYALPDAAALPAAATDPQAACWQHDPETGEDLWWPDLQVDPLPECVNAKP